MISNLHMANVNKVKSMTVTMERAQIEDVPKLIRVQDLSFREDYEKFGECPSYQETPENMADMITHAIVYKILTKDEIIGDIIIRKREEGHYYLRTLSVVPACQNHGVGKQAIAFIEQDLDDGEIWSLITPAGSLKNRHFYESLGYRKAGEKVYSDKLILIEYQKILFKMNI